MKNPLYTFWLLLAVIGNAHATTIVTPKITKISVTPNSAIAGTMFKFTAELNNSLPSGDKVKIDLGKGLASMTGKNTSYSLSRAIYTTGKQTYKVGIYNSKNVLQGKVSSGSYTISGSKNEPPALTLVSGENSVEQNKLYTLQLKASDVDGNLRSITVNWKDGSAIETQTATNDATLTFTHTFTATGIFKFTATAKDIGSPPLTSKPLFKNIEVTPEIPRYSKVCNSGALEGEEDCPIDPVVGDKPTDWACTIDNDTGLMWEVKTTDGGLHDMNKTYTNYTVDYDPKKIYGDATNTDGFVLDVNAQSLCGASDWRLPTKEELLGIVKLGSYPTIDTTYFPNTKSGWFWSSSPNVNGSGNAWLVGFGIDGSYDNYKEYSVNVRLVR